MLRLTTKVAVSPASSARSSSAATRISSITSGRVSANSAVSSSSRQRLAGAAPLDRPRRELRIDLALAAPARAAARDEAPVLELDQVEHPLLHPLGVEVLRVDAEALGQRVARGAEPLADLVGARERVLGRDVVAVRREPAEVGRPGLDQVDPPVAQVRRDLDPDVGHQPPALGDQPLHLLERHVARPVRHRLARRRAASRRRSSAPRPRRRRSRRPRARSSGDAGRSSGGSPPGGGRGARATSASASSAAIRSSSVSPMPTRIPLVNGILSSPAASIVSRRTRRVLGRRALRGRRGRG